ncbi:Hypothetical protein R9X50_00255200 [Acrodontium crateriforme]|uniref:Uncharacterized protein n=1 Tax=Acrodontium crateriforme TaxID=150365 RepID=A0AAQ3M181_9PEZI|nr:Hypothetical protein R9X50_00255200 [Acrodontium crateriforme]
MTITGQCNFDIPRYDCTLETCCLAQSSFLYIPSFGGNLFFTIFFAAAIIPQLIIGIWYRTWGFAVGMFCGLLLEVIGYVARVMLHGSPFDANPFLIYLICLTIAPVFITAAIYLCLTRIIVIYGEHNSRIRPSTIAIIFMTSDFLSLVLQAIGGAIADTADDHTTGRHGIDIMIAGLMLQVISLALFLSFVAHFTWRCSRGVLNQDPEKVRVRQRSAFRVFMACLLLATVAVLVRSIFRVAELWEGFRGKLWNNETDFLVLDGAMMALATILLTAFHPGPAFGGQWSAANWTFKSKKPKTTSEIDLATHDAAKY